MSSIFRRAALSVVVLTMAVSLAAAVGPLKPHPDAPSQCPCFSQADVEAVPVPYMQCVIDANFTPNPNDYTLTTNIIYVQGISGAEAKVNADDKAGMCSYVDIDDPLHTFIHIEDLKYKEAVACRDYIVNVIGDGGSCDYLCIGDECDDD